MKQSIKKPLALAALLLAAGALAACGSLSHGITKDGSHASQLVWPAANATNPLHTGGTFPNLDNLRQVQAGLNKNQIIALIGAPHFNEGMAGVHEWNYLFNFRKDGQVTQCGYKILFDSNMIARSFYWNPAACADFVNPPAPKPAPAPTSEKFTLAGDALFKFDRSGLGDITHDGVAQLDKIAGQLTAASVKGDEITVIGYTDRLGSNAYNQKLSEHRAKTIRDYLVSKGVDAGHITSQGKGEADPVVQCNDKAKAKLIACLAPNRRVVITATGTH